MMVSAADLAARKRRLRMGIFALAFGVVLIVWAWASWIYRSSAESLPPTGATPIAPRAAGDPAAPLKALAVWLALVFVLFLVVLISSYAISRSKRRHLAQQSHTRAAATQSEDLWSRHELPDRDSIR